MQQNLDQVYRDIVNKRLAELEQFAETVNNFAEAMNTNMVAIIARLESLEKVASTRDASRVGCDEQTTCSEE